MSKNTHVFAVAVMRWGEMTIMSPWFCYKCCCESFAERAVAEHEDWCRPGTHTFIYRHAISQWEWDRIVDWPGEEGCRKGPHVDAW